MIAGILFIVFCSCESIVQSVETAYLGFEGNLHDPQTIWQNMGVYSSAYDRMVEHLKIENNQLTWDLFSAQI